MTGLQSTLLQYKPLIKKFAEGLQIIHCHGYHYVVAHKETASTDIVKVYNTLSDAADDTINPLRTVVAYMHQGNKDFTVQTNHYNFASLHPINLKPVSFCLL